MFAEEDCRPISALQHLLFCPRQCALIHLEQLWADNALTITGKQLHEKVDAGRTNRRKNTPETTRSLMLRSLKLGIYGKADVVEFRPPTGDTIVSASVPGKTSPGTDEAGGTAGAGPMPIKPACLPGVPFPVEYKRGKPKKNRCDEVQLCAQALCLEEMLGVPVPAGAIFYGVTRRRVDTAFDNALRTLTRDTIDLLHAMLAGGVTPVARREKKCDRCSLKTLCLPEVLAGREKASRYWARSLTNTLRTNPDGHSV